MEMSTTYYPQPESLYKKVFLYSCLIHVALAVSFIIDAAFFSSEKIDYSTAVRVDLVGLPDKIVNPSAVTEPAPKEAMPEKPTVPEAKVVEAPKDIAKKEAAQVDPDSVKIEKDAKKKQSSALDKIKSMQALDKIKNEVSKEKPKAAAQVKGNVIAPGTALSGLSQLQHNSYIGQIDQHIKNNWALPQWMSNKNFKAQVLVKFNEQGQIISRVIAKSSGNGIYDDLALDTIDKSAPFPAPPEKFTDIFKYQGILVGFPE